MVAAGAVASGTALMASGESKPKASQISNGVVVGTSRKKEINYTKTAAWEEFYRSAK
jgi:hypothetical protein